LYAAFNFIGFALVGRIVSTGVILTFLGVVFLVSGIVVMGNFIKRHPKIMLSEESGEREEKW
jgi:hypothetical protein